MRVWRAAAGVVLLAGSLSLAAQSPAALTQRLDAMARPPVGQTAPLHGASLDWHGLHFNFADGVMTLAAAVEGQVTSAAFSGAGTLQVAAPSAPAWRRAIEQQQMERFLGRPEIQVNFTAAVFRFANPDALVRGLQPAAHFTPGPDNDAAKLWRDRAQEAEKSGAPIMARVQAALDSQGASSELLLAELKVRDGWVDVQYDPAKPEPLRIVAEGKDRNGDAGGEIWTEFAPDAAKAPVPLPAVGDYGIQLKVASNLELQARVQVRIAGSGERGVLLGLDSGLRVSSVQAQGEEVSWAQAKAPGAWLYVQLPSPLQAGLPLSLTITYQGQGGLRSGATGHDWASVPGWYPVVIGDDPAPLARFHIQVDADKRFHVLTTPADLPLRAAGIALGEDEISTRSLRLADGSSLEATVAAPRKEDPLGLAPLAGAKLLDAINVLGTAFGPYPWKSTGLAVSGAATGSMPGLIIFDPRWFVDTGSAQSQLDPAVSVAAQWWGGSSVAAGPHDEWLISGLEAAGGLIYQEDRYGRDASAATLRSWRDYLLEKDEAGRVPADSGPLWLGGERLSAPGEIGQVALFAKSGYVIEMIREMLRDPRTANPDAGFIALMRDYRRAYGAAPLRTADFQAMVEKHMTSAMDLDHRHSMDWFFQPLLWGRLIPHLSFHAEEAPAVKGVAQVALTVDNPQHWRGLLPVYLFRDQDTWVRGMIPVMQDHVALTVPAPFTPRYVEANHFNDMLVLVNQ